MIEYAATIHFTSFLRTRILWAKEPVSRKYLKNWADVSGWELTFTYDRSGKLMHVTFVRGDFAVSRNYIPYIVSNARLETDVSGGQLIDAPLADQVVFSEMRRIGIRPDAVPRNKLFRRVLEL